MSDTNNSKNKPKLYLHTVRRKWNIGATESDLIAIDSIMVRKDNKEINPNVKYYYNGFERLKDWNIKKITNTVWNNTHFSKYVRWRGILVDF